MLRFCKYGLLLISVIFISGCWDFAVLRDRAVMLGIAVDNLDQGYRLGFEIVQFANANSQAEGGAGKPVVFISTIPIKSIEIPLHAIQSRLSGHPFYPNVHILAIGKKQAQLGISDIISHFLRDPDMRRATQVVIAEEEATELLQIKTTQENFVSYYFEKLVEETEHTGKTITSDIGDISRAIHEKTVSFIPLLAASPAKTEAKVIGTALLVEGKWVDQLSEEETKAVAYASNPVVEDGSFRIDCPETGTDSIAMDIIKVKPSLKPTVSGEHLIIQGTSRVIGYLSEYTCSDGKVLGRTTLESLEKKMSKKLNDEVHAHLTSVLHRTGADVLDIRSKLERKDPKHWKKIEHKFKDMLRNAEVDISVTVELINKGSES